MKVLHAVLAGLLVSLGVLHLGFTSSVYESLGAEALWFAGTGLFLVSAGLLNLAVLRTAERDVVARSCGLAVNLLGVGMAVWALRSVGGWQPYVLLGLFSANFLLLVLGRCRQPSEVSKSVPPSPTRRTHRVENLNGVDKR